MGMFTLTPHQGRLGLAFVFAAALATASFTAEAKKSGGGLWPLRASSVDLTYYDGVSDDLLTAGLGASGLANPTPPGIADPLNPTAAELRRLAIYGNYRALIDTAPGGGYGVLYGPNIAADGGDTGGEGLIAGHEVVVYARRGAGKRNVAILIQVPDSFDPATPCIVTGPSSGSRGIYGAIGTAGEWGLKNGCVVAYTDKGTGTGAHDLSQDLVSLITGERVAVADAGRSSHFTAPLSRRAQERYAAEFPDRFAFKHAHSKQNPEADWGRDVLDSIRVAFAAMNLLHDDPHAASRADDASNTLREHDFGEKGWDRARFKPANTIVIASSVSNGGGSSLRAAEIDRFGLIDGIAVSEPNVNPRFDKRFAIIQGDGEPLREHSRSLYDYTTLLNVFQGCASNLVQDPPAPFNFAPSPDACASLASLGLLSGSDLQAQAAEAQTIINDYGFLPEQNALQPSHWFINVPQAISVTYANAYGRIGVERNLCGYSFGATDATTAAPVPLPDAAQAVLFSTSNGIPPTGGVNLLNNTAAGGAVEYRASTVDQYLDGALCLRGLAVNGDPATGDKLEGQARRDANRIGGGVRDIRAHGDLGGRPALIVTGRDDAILPPNHTSRAYFGLNKLVEGKRSGLRYYEVLNAHHLDALNGLAGFSDRWVPLHHYFVQIHDLLLAHLRNGAPLPPSQLVRTTPRGVDGGGAVPAITLANLPDLASDPGADAILFDGDVRIPD
jgi:hydroxybutyrate-dimer hydrolase